MLTYPGGGRLWSHDQEQERLNYLRRPIPSNVNDPKLMKEVRIRVLRPFGHQRRVVVLDEVISVPEYLAADLVAIKKAERV